MNAITCLMLIAFLDVAAIHEAATWGYGESHGEVYGPADWDQVAPQCAFQHQSPVNIPEENTRKCLPELSLEHEQEEVIGTFTNNGHAPTFAIDKSYGTGTLKGGPLKGSYELQQFHFHFGCESDKGSEHTVEGNAFSAELHLVFYNTKYVDFSTAADKPDGLAVVGVFLEERSEETNEVLKRLTDKLTDIEEEEKSVNFDEGDEIDLEDLVPELDPYHTYKGSLTTPNCYESVQWIVLEKMIPVSSEQLEAFKTLKAEHGYEHGKMCNNFRPTQPINGRDIYYVTC